MLRIARLALPILVLNGIASAATLSFAPSKPWDLVEPGETVEVSVMLADNPGIQGMDIYLSIEEPYAISEVSYGQLWSTVTYGAPFVEQFTTADTAGVTYSAAIAVCWVAAPTTLLSGDGELLRFQLVVPMIAPVKTLRSQCPTDGPNAPWFESYLGDPTVPINQAFALVAPEPNCLVLLSLGGLTLLARRR